MSGHRNRLAEETSPYLLQHASNPVDWYPWGEEAFAQARELQRPILLSIGYSACHWCHVMERESFEDLETAALMNEQFVCIKVDREERPDLDDIYMRAVQTMTGQGGWPLTVFLTPDLEPFAGGTYFPPEDHPYLPAFRTVLRSIVNAWNNDRQHVGSLAATIRQHLQPATLQPGPTLPDVEWIDRAVMQLHDRFDANFGGFGPAPKFPNTTWVALVLRYAAGQGEADLLREATFTLEQMSCGGIYDHVGGGFHRYATDGRWLVPHFEKMLYDNALIAGVLLDAYQVTGRDEFARTANETFDWVLRQMQHPDGGFFSSLDADSEGVEGRYYVWPFEQLRQVLGDEAAWFCPLYGATESGNWEGTNILHLPEPLAQVARRQRIQEATVRERAQQHLRRLRQARANRPAPALDDKILADWNGWMVAALARGARVLGHTDYLDAARRGAEFVLRTMVLDGNLRHAYRDGSARFGGFLDDYAAMLWACIELFETTFEACWLQRARALADTLLERFDDPVSGALFSAADDDERLIARTLTGQDGATPSGNGMAATWLYRLGIITGSQRYQDRARAIVQAFEPQIRRVPFAFAQLLLALESQHAEPSEIVVVGRHTAATAEALQRLRRRYDPNTVVLYLDPDTDQAARLQADVPALEGKGAIARPDGRPVFCRCRGRTCEAPTTNLDAVLSC